MPEHKFSVYILLHGGNSVVSGIGIGEKGCVWQGVADTTPLYLQAFLK